MSNQLVLIAFVAAISIAVRADDDNDDRLRAVPFVFVGEKGDCGPVPGSNIVTAAWLRGMGLPDNGQPNTTLVDVATANTPASRKDPHTGLLLNKNGPSGDCSAAGARIRGVEGTKVGADFALGFDYRNGTHCGAGAPRFNVVSRLGKDETFHFVGGCGNAAPTAAPQDPTEWSRVRFLTANPAQAFPPIAPGSVIVSITLIHDEGTENAGVEDPRGVGLSNVDNIFINGRFIRSGKGIEPHGNSDTD